jgi:hypothetical protein
MTKFLMVCAVSATALLGGCASTGGVQAPLPANVVAIIAQVQGYAKTYCGFVPTAATIAQLIGGGNTSVTSVIALAQAICASLNPVVVMAAGKPSAARTINGFRVTSGKVNGVTIRGSRA